LGFDGVTHSIQGDGHVVEVVAAALVTNSSVPQLE
jgi:hypothetical protein